MSIAQKKKILQGMPPTTARKRFLEIWGAKFPDQDFIKVHGKIWPWLETWHRLRAHNETFDTVAQAFAEKISNMHKRVHRLEQIIHDQRAELAKRCAQLEAAKAELSPQHSFAPPSQKEKP